MARTKSAGLVMRKTSGWFYGQVTIDGKQVVKKLGVRIEGQHPARISEEGDRAFERSRGKAEVALKNLQGQINSNETEVALAEAVYEARAGVKFERKPVSAFKDIWDSKPRNKKPSPQHRELCHGKLDAFSRHLAGMDPELKYIDQIRFDHVRSFLDSLVETGLSNDTWNKYLTTIRGVLRRGGSSAAEEFVQKEVETISREPFEVEELHAIFDAAQKHDPMMYPIIITAATTAMRRKDCCFLKWNSIDLKAGFIKVKTSKTNKTVDIPMADMLRVEIEKQVGNNSQFVFPDAHQQYVTDDKVLTRRFKKVLRLAGFDDGKSAPVKYETDSYNQEELYQAIDQMYFGKKKAHARSVLSRYLAGDSLSKSAEVAGVAKSTASLYLNAIEQKTQTAFIRGKQRKIDSVSRPTRGAIQKDRENGVLKASVKGFHSFRTTWVTLALMNGMPIDTVRLVTGHQTADIVTTHYFNPQREKLKAAMQKSLPGLLTCSQSLATPAEAAIKVLTSMNASNWKKLRDQAVQLLETV